MTDHQTATKMCICLLLLGAGEAWRGSLGASFMKQCVQGGTVMPSHAETLKHVGAKEKN